MKNFSYLSDEEFDQALSILRESKKLSDVTINAAKLVLVDRKTLNNASEMCGVSYTSISKAVKAIDALASTSKDVKVTVEVDETIKQYEITRSRLAQLDLD